MLEPAAVSTDAVMEAAPAAGTYITCAENEEPEDMRWDRRGAKGIKRVARGNKTEAQTFHAVALPTVASTMLWVR